MILLNLQIVTSILVVSGYFFAVNEVIYKRFPSILTIFYVIFTIIIYIYFSLNGDLFLFYDRVIYQLRANQALPPSIDLNFLYTLIYQKFYNIDPFYGVVLFTAIPVVLKLRLIKQNTHYVGPIFVYVSLSFWYDDYQQLKFGFSSLFILYFLLRGRTHNILIAIVFHAGSSVYLLISKFLAGKYTLLSIRFMPLLPLLLHITLLQGPAFDIFWIIGGLIPGQSSYYGYYIDAMNGSASDFNLFRLTNILLALAISFTILLPKTIRSHDNYKRIFYPLLCCELFYQLFLFSPTVAGRFYHILEVSLIPFSVHILRYKTSQIGHLNILLLIIYSYCFAKYFSNVSNGYFGQVFD
jgi:hypothetical protein